MIKNTPTNSTSSTANPVKKKLRLKVILYILLILILLILSSTIYFKIKYYLNHNNEGISIDHQIQDQNDSINSINSNMLSELLQKQNEFQQDVHNKINELTNEIKNNKNYHSKLETPNSDPSKVIVLEKTPVVSPTISSKKYIKDNLGVVYNLIQALNSNRSFIRELDAFKITPEAQNFNKEISSLYNVAATGISTSYDLALSFKMLNPYIKIECYHQDIGILGKIKYYLSFFLVVQKVNNFKETDFTLDSNLYNIENLLLENKPENALYVVENNLKNIKVLTTWYADLSHRVLANYFALKLQQYLLNSLYVDN